MATVAVEPATTSRVVAIIEDGGKGDRRSGFSEGQNGRVVAIPKTTTESPPQAKTTTKPLQKEKTTTKKRRSFAYRIEINRRKKKGDGFTYHYIYRQTIDKQRFAEYGGKLDKLMAKEPGRWEQYLDNSKNNTRRRKDG